MPAVPGDQPSAKTLPRRGIRKGGGPGQGPLSERPRRGVCRLAFHARAAYHGGTDLTLTANRQPRTLTLLPL